MYGMSRVCIGLHQQSLIKVSGVCLDTPQHCNSRLCCHNDSDDEADDEVDDEADTNGHQ